MRDKILHFRVNEYEYSAIQSMAQKENRTVSELIRETLRKEAQENLSTSETE
ncbi:MAG: ribbon-helix-helix protein, CopG family [Anaerolineales bacterium]|nr:ribbon-helix-helix protein, CopG family [Anaerolineales bacterium]